MFPEMQCLMDPDEFVLQDSHHVSLAVFGEDTTEVLYRW